MYCKNCGTKLPDEALFCAQCGTRTERPAEADYPKAAYKPAGRSPAGRAAAAPVRLSADPLMKRRVIAAVLTVAALLLLATNWVVVMGEARYGMSLIWQAADSGLEELEERAGWLSGSLDLGPLRQDISNAMDGRYTPLELFSAGKDLLPVIQNIRDVMAWSGDADDGSFLALALVIVAFMCLVAVIAVSGCVAVFKHLFGKQKRAGKLFFALQLVLFLILTALCCLLYAASEMPIRPTLTALAAVILAGVAARRYGPEPEQEPAAPAAAEPEGTE